MRRRRRIGSSIPTPLRGSPFLSRPIELAKNLPSSGQFWRTWMDHGSEASEVTLSCIHPAGDANQQLRAAALR